jgi:hypothetical protein
LISFSLALAAVRLQLWPSSLTLMGLGKFVVSGIEPPI